MRKSAFTESLNVHFEASDDDLFFNLLSSIDISQFLQLRREIDKEGYNSFCILKRNGKKRKIDAPKPFLKIIQRLLLDNLLYKVPVSDFCFGFVKNKSIKDNATPHIKSNTIIKIDIKNFFKSTTVDHVTSVLPNIGIKESFSIYLFKKICTKDFSLPQGAPTSPMLANICFLTVDREIAEYCEKNSVTYTRYADDLTFSGSNLPIKKLIAIVSRILNRHGYEVQKNKTKVMHKGSRQTVTGIIVNDKISVSRHLRRNIRAAINNIKNGKQPYLNGRDISITQIKGYINYIEGISKEQAVALRKELYKINL